MTSRRRILILTVLVAATLLYRGIDIYQVVFTLKSRSMEGFVQTVEAGHLTVEDVSMRDWTGRLTPAYKAGLQKGDWLLEVYNVRGEGGPIRGFFDYGAVVRTIGRSEPWTVVVSRVGEGGERTSIRLTIPPGPAYRDFRTRLLILALAIMLPLLAIVTAFFIGFMRPDDDNAFLASLLFLGFSAIFGVDAYLFPSGFRTFGLIYHISLNSFLAYFFMRFFLFFPSPSWIERKFPWLKKAFLAFTVGLWILSLTSSFLFSVDFGLFERANALLSMVDSLLGAGVLAMFIIGMTSLVLNTVGAHSKDEKRRMVILLFGTLVGLVPLGGYAIYVAVFAVGIPPWWLIATVGATLGLFPLSFVYVVLRHRVLGIRLIIRRSLQYALVSRGFLLFEGTLFQLAYSLGMGPIFAKYFPGAAEVHIMATTVLTVAVVFGLREVNRRVMPAIDRRFFREAYDAQQLLTELSRTARRLVLQPERLLETVADSISDSFYATHVAIFLRGASRHGTSFDIHHKGDFELYLLRSRSESGEEVVSRGVRRFRLSPHSFIVRYLKRAVSKDPETLEIYPNDPKSWANALMRVHPASTERAMERDLIESLQTRLIVPLVAHRDIFGFIAIGEKLSEEPYSYEDRELLLTVAEQTALALDYAHLIGEVSEKERLKREIEIAKEVQAQLFPQFLPPMKTLEYTGMCRAARGVGGDYYDFLQTGPGQLCIALGDISGKGISASMLMANLQALLRSHAPRRGVAVDQLVSDINQLMCPSSDGSKYATFFCGVYDDVARTLTYVNAGHNPPVILRRLSSSCGRLALAGSGEETLLGHRVGRLHNGGTVVGLFPQAVYEKETVQLCPGDLIVVYTDGVTEAFNIKEEEFGEDRLLRLLVENSDLSVTDLTSEILAQIEKHADGNAQSDDVTLVIARVK